MSEELAGWLSEGQWAALVPLAQQLPAFAGLLKDLERNGDDWCQWVAAPEDEPMPGALAAVPPAPDQG
jgi:hypothetical protein